MYNEIILPKGNKKKLAVALNVNRNTVSSALLFRRNTDIEKRIQREALENFDGELIEKRKARKSNVLIEAT
ncbi:MAG: hypothetical protein ACRDDZ_01495 [Marinifilaceae bacterium]